MLSDDDENFQDDTVALKADSGPESRALYPFLVWRRRLGLTQPEAAKLIDRTTRQVVTYDKMRELPALVRLAMVAIEYLPSWRLAEVGIVPYWRRRRPHPSRS
jgi:DNA-binding XRE family transcriptional regulator